MKAFAKTLLALAASALLALTASANYRYGSDDHFYVGAKAGQADVNFSNKATMYGAYAGYNFNDNVGVEAEFLGSDETTLGSTKYTAKTYGAYGTYRLQLPSTPIYVKGKLGAAVTERDVKSTVANPDLRQTSLAGGAGIGFKATEDFAIEATYNYLNANHKMLSVGAHFAF